MKWQVIYNLFKIRRQLSPDRGYKAVLWNKLSNQWHAVYRHDFRWYQTLVFRVTVASIAGLLVLGSFSTAAYAYVSSEVYESTLLYPVKQVLEKVEGLMKVTPAAKAAFNLKKISRREAEKTVVENKLGKASTKLEKINSRIEKIEDDLVVSADKIDEIKAQDTDLAKKVENQLEKRKVRLENKIEKNNEHLDKVGEKMEKIEQKNSLNTLDVSGGKGRGEKTKRNEDKK
jgi:hypothetical protein